MTAGGSRVDDQGFYAYGRAQKAPGRGIIGVERSFTGQQKDFSSGLIYMNARYYAPELGQFLREPSGRDTLVPDPGNLFDYNRYLYTRGNPMRYNDPTGHCAKAQPDTSDQEAYTEWLNCGQMVNTILAQWDTTPNYWNNLYTSKEVFEKGIAWNPNTHSNLFSANLLYWQQSDEYQAKFGGGGEPAPSQPNDEFGCGGGRACQALVRHALYINQKCQEIDCVGIGNDVVGVASAGLVLSTPLCPACGTVGGYLGYSSTIAGVGWTTYNWYKNKSSEADLAVTAELAYRGLTTKSNPWGLAYSTIQLVWDVFISPNDPWE